jgi:hypothetical protein
MIEGRLSGQIQPSGLRAARAASPPTETNLEFELSVRHATFYPKLVHVNLSDFGIRTHDLLASARSPRRATALLWNSEGAQRQTVEYSNYLPQGFIGYNLCDPRLKQLRINGWTRVPMQDHLAAGLISHFLENDHPYLGFFDADLFVEDLVHHRRRYCSSFLVNAVLYIAAVCHSS